MVWQRAKQTASHVFSFFLFYKLVYLLALILSPAVSDRERDRVRDEHCLPSARLRGWSRARKGLRRNVISVMLSSRGLAYAHWLEH